MRKMSRRRAGDAGGTARAATPRARAGGRGEAVSEPRASLYAEVTNRIVAELEAGRFPWVQPWSSTGAQPGLPRNAATRRPYSGINILLLWGAVIERGYPCQGWLTFRQALDAGGAVRKGERGTTIVYADRFTPEAERSRAESDGGGEGIPSSLRGSDDPRSRAIPFLKRFTVFNVAQIDGLALLDLDAEAATVIGGHGDAYGTAELFVALLGLDDAAILAVVAVAMGEALEAGGMVVEAVGRQLGVDLKGEWQPDAAFFDLVRDKEVAAALVADIAGEAVAAAIPLARDTVSRQRDNLLRKREYHSFSAASRELEPLGNSSRRLSRRRRRSGMLS